VARFFLALNAFCWLLFLTREPVNADDYAMSRILPGGGIEFTGSTATPHVVASRTVARGGWHGVGTRPVETYRLLNQPALLLGLLLYPIGWIGFTFGINAVRIISLSPASPLTANPESWILAGSLLLATSLQWGLIGRFFDRRLATRSVRISEAVVRRALIATFIAVACAVTAWGWPAERDWYLLTSSFDGKPAPLLKALESEPRNAGLWRRLGRSYRMKDRWREALPAYQRSVELDPSDFDAWADIRLSALCLKKESEAEQATKRLFALDASWAAQRVSGLPNCCAFEVCEK